MKRALEFLRFFLIGPELFFALGAIYLELRMAEQIASWFAQVHMPDDQFKWIVAVPAVLCGWSFVSGKKLLFPEKDKNSILQCWPDYWRLRLAFHAALSWNTIFLLTSMLAWLGDWKNPTATSIILLALSIAGAAICSLSIYNAQTRVEEIVSQYRAAKQ
ncbi:hypothetical protein [Ralstonia mannitolilytica]|uniref:hypothetical protein n=1 Tax=Ralstonia mannitolilytica TaxID=105219 RepID=UPI002931B4C9|nr:hypothetical protein [Ralstonia mannitolilytica]